MLMKKKTKQQLILERAEDQENKGWLLLSEKGMNDIWGDVKKDHVQEQYVP